MPRRTPPIVAGQQFYQLTAIHMIPRTSSSEANKWLCECDCGQSKVATVSQLWKGTLKSCGCRKHAPTPSKHGAAVGGKFSAEYNTWRSMKSRCQDKNDKVYGGRGIAVCKEWMNDFETFLAHMGPRPEGCSIDRIDNSKGYAPGNVRWASKSDQMKNKRNACLVTIAGVTKNLVDWANESGIDYSVLHQRIKHNCPEYLLLRPVGKGILGPLRRMHNGTSK